MAGQSGHNLNISKFRRGTPRFPFECRDAGEGYARAGPVTVRQLTPEERDKYPPAPAVVRNRSITAGAVKWAVKRSAGLADAARMLCVSELRLKSEMARFNVAMPEEWEEDENMELTTKTCNETAVLGENTEILRNETGDLRNDGQAEKTSAALGGGTHHFERPKTRLEIAREKLSREEYLQFRNQGQNDKQIYTRLDIAPDTFYRLKEEWGLKGYHSGKKEGAPVDSRITISQALELRDELEEDLDHLNYMLGQAEAVGLSPRLTSLLAWYRDEYRRALERIGEVFEKTEVQL